MQQKIWSVSTAIDNPRFCSLLFCIYTVTLEMSVQLNTAELIIKHS